MDDKIWRHVNRVRESQSHSENPLEELLCVLPETVSIQNCYKHLCGFWRPFYFSHSQVVLTIHKLHFTTYIIPNWGSMRCFTFTETKKKIVLLCYSPSWEGEKQGGLYFNEHAQKEKMKTKQKNLCWWLFSPHQCIPDSAAHKAEQLRAESLFLCPLTTKQCHHLNQKVLDPCSVISGFYVCRHFNRAHRITEHNLHGSQHFFRMAKWYRLSKQHAVYGLALWTATIHKASGAGHIWISKQSSLFFAVPSWWLDLGWVFCKC